LLQPLRGDDLRSVSSKNPVTAANLSSCRDAFFPSGEAGLKIREDYLADENDRRMKSVFADLAIPVGLQRRRIQQLESPNPSLQRKSK
jgi:hypothetical protein